MSSVLDFDSCPKCRCVAMVDHDLRRHVDYLSCYTCGYSLTFDRETASSEEVGGQGLYAYQQKGGRGYCLSPFTADFLVDDFTAIISQHRSDFQWVWYSVKTDSGWQKIDLVDKHEEEFFAKDYREEDFHVEG